MSRSAFSDIGFTGLLHHRDEISWFLFCLAPFKLSLPNIYNPHFFIRIKNIAPLLIHTIKIYYSLFTCKIILTQLVCLSFSLKIHLCLEVTENMNNSRFKKKKNSIKCERSTDFNERVKSPRQHFRLVSSACLYMMHCIRYSIWIKLCNCKENKAQENKHYHLVIVSINDSVTMYCMMIWCYNIYHNRRFYGCCSHITHIMIPWPPIKHVALTNNCSQPSCCRGSLKCYIHIIEITLRVQPLNRCCSVS